ncbi:hypothetical protein [Streptomyces paromomycinus]|uniref:Uncharacterized protein n=1 Tax=Streptomyces paromomycinus TaxID=92743 RepID=A0A401W6I8_STREY|nr:hypothetical protein [Streptomyces paromomycinus]GCD44973.1 hypothetical protein GKJPGBOP_04692 [Streptomyces paromomycinus]
MSAHQPVTAAVRNGAAEPTPTMNQLLAACAAASAVSTPPQPPSRAEAAEDPENAENAENAENGATAEREAARENVDPGPQGAAARDAA